MLPYSLADMNLKQNCAFIAGFLVVFTLLAATGCSTAMPYQETRSGNYFYLNPFSYKPATAEEHWKYAESLREDGHDRSARKQYEIFVKRWPEDVHAPAAKQRVAEIYFAKGKNKKAFTAYEELIQQYYSSIKDYNAILDQQYVLAEKEMNRKRMRWLFGGYRAPERAVPLFESIIKNAPQWERAPEMQYMIGEAYQKNDDLELAVVAYSATEYRYPNSPFAEKAAVSKIGSFKKLVDTTPYSVDIREQAQLSAGMFPELYTNSQHIAEAQEFGKELHGLDAQHNYEIGRFYERVPRPVQTNSAVIYYNKVIKKYGDTEYAAKAAERLRVLFPHGEVILADGTKAPILPVDDMTGESGGGTFASSNVTISVAGGKPAAATGGAVHAEVNPLPERTTMDANAVEVTADRMEYLGKLLIGEGNVAVQQANASLQADRVTVNSETGEINASGNILMIRDGNRWEGQELVYNYKTREGNFGKSAMYFEPAYITAESTERISTNEYVMHNAMMTTCSGENPIVYAKAKEVRVIDDHKTTGIYVKAKSVTFYIGPVPIFYTPIWHRRFGDRVFNFTLGYDGHLGAFTRGSATIHPNEWLTAETHLDLYSQRGLGLGQDFRWKTPYGGGAIETYYINDNKPYDNGIHNMGYDKSLVDAQRYRVKFTDHEAIDEQTYLATKLNWLSDPLITKDFFNDEFRHQMNPENYAVVQRSADDYAASVRIDHRMNDFYETVNRMPELTYDRYRSRLGDSPFYFESENNAAFLETLKAKTNSMPALPGYDSARFDSYNRLFLPLRFKDFFNVIPRAGYRGTWYSQTDTPTKDPGYRNLFELGTLTSFKTYKTLTEKSGFYGTGLRHVAEPYVDYSWRAAPDLRTNDIYQFDAVDALDKQNEARFGIRNYLQTKRGTKRIVNFVNSDVYTTERFDPATGERSFSNLVADAEFSLTDNFFIQSDLQYDWYKQTINPANARLKFVTDDQSEYSIEYRYLEGTRSLVTPRVKLFPNDNWSYEFSASYDQKFDEWYERKILINHKFNCIGMGVGFRIDEEDTAQFWVQFWLTAFPKSPLKL